MINLPVTLEAIDACSSMEEKFLLIQPEKTYELNERDYAHLFATVVHSYLRPNVSKKFWKYYDGLRWVDDEGNIKLKQQMKLFSIELYKYACSNVSPNDEDYFEFILDMTARTKRNTLIKDAYDVYPVSNDDFDKNPYLFNCQNVTIDLQTSNIHPHTPDDMITQVANVYYDPSAVSPLLDDFFQKIFCGDNALINYVSTVLGYSLSGLTSEECMFIVLGETTRNGKSTLLNTFAYMLGNSQGYAVNVDVSTFAQKKFMNGSAPSGDIARMRGSRFAVASEPPQDFIMDEAKLKAFTGRDTITARNLRESEQEFIPTFKIFIGTNHRPEIMDDSIIESNRLRVIPFNHHFTVAEQYKNLRTKLMQPNELSALLNFCLKGFSQYAQHGLVEPVAVKQAIDEYQTQGQILQTFFNSELYESPGAVIPLPKFYPLYEKWCNDNAFTPMPKHKVNQCMRAKGIFKASGTYNHKTERNLLVGYSLTKKEAQTSVKDAELPF